MRYEDKDVMCKFFPEWAGYCENIKDVAIIAPNDFELDIMKKLFPKSKIHGIEGTDPAASFVQEKHWNLDEKCTLGKFDLILISNTFMYTSIPDVWFKNIMDVTRYLWIQDCCSGLRGNGQYLGEDGDAMRYEYKNHFKSDYEFAYDLDIYNDYITSYVHYKLGTGSHFIMSFDFGEK